MPRVVCVLLLVGLLLSVVEHSAFGKPVVATNPRESRVDLGVTNQYVLPARQGLQRKVKQVDDTGWMVADTAQIQGGTGHSRGDGEDVFTRNNLLSPLCSQTMLVMMMQREKNCVRSGMVSAIAPISSLQFDKLVETTGGPGGLVPKPDGIFTTLILTMLNAAWGMVLHVVHAVFLAIEWAFGFNIATNSVLEQIGHVVGSSVKRVVLMFAGLGAAAFGGWVVWVGAMKRQTTRALKRAASVSIAFVSVFVVFANPVGTVGQLSGLSSQIATWLLSSLSGNIHDERAGLEDASQALYRAVVLPATAQMMFGDVDWGANPDRLNLQLKRAAMKIAKHESVAIQQRVSQAKTNVEIFSVWEGNAPERVQFTQDHDQPVDGILQYTPVGAAVNGADDLLNGGGGGDKLHGEQSLLESLCGGSNSNDCQGKYADVVEWQTESHVWDRLIGFVFVAASLLVFCLLCGSLALTLIAANVLVAVFVFQLGLTAGMAFFGSAGFDRFLEVAKNLATAILAPIGCGATLGIVTVIWGALTNIPALGFVISWLLVTIAMVAIFRRRKTLWGQKRNRANVRVASAPVQRVVDRLRPAPNVLSRMMNGAAIGYASANMVSEKDHPHPQLPARLQTFFSSTPKPEQNASYPSQNKNPTHAQQTQHEQSHHGIQQQQPHDNQPVNNQEAVSSREPLGKDAQLSIRQRATRSLEHAQPVAQGYSSGGVAGGVAAGAGVFTRNVLLKRNERRQQQENLRQDVPPIPHGNIQSIPHSRRPYHHSNPSSQEELQQRREEYLTYRGQPKQQPSTTATTQLSSQVSDNAIKQTSSKNEEIKKQQPGSETVPLVWQQLKRWKKL